MPHLKHLLLEERHSLPRLCIPFLPNPRNLVELFKLLPHTFRLLRTLPLHLHFVIDVGLWCSGRGEKRLMLLQFSRLQGGVISFGFCDTSAKRLIDRELCGSDSFSEIVNGRSRRRC